MLSDFQQTSVWESWLSAQIRAAYFANLVQRCQMQQKWLAFGSLLLSSAATFTLLTATIPAHLGWVKPVLTVLAASLSLWSLVARTNAPRSTART